MIYAVLFLCVSQLALVGLAWTLMRQLRQHEKRLDGLGGMMVQVASKTETPILAPVA